MECVCVIIFEHRLNLPTMNTPDFRILFNQTLIYLFKYVQIIVVVVVVVCNIFCGLLKY